ncbi:MAG: sel1 repeat family protein [Lentisphaeraceae bacterium]|nr:sel1 repeat family protein [Lentisphaeraceae bacterium]
MIFRLFCIFLFISASVYGEKKWQSIVWETPKGWELVEVGQAHFPYVFVGENKHKISFLRYEFRNDAVWVFSKVYREELGLPLLTEQELRSKEVTLENEAVYYEFSNNEKVVSCAFYNDFGFLWILKFEGKKEASVNLSKTVKAIAASIKPNEKFTAHVEELIAKKDDDKNALKLAEYYELGFGVEREPKRGFEILLKLHEKGVLDATYKLASKFLEVNKVSQAFSLLQKGVDGNHLPSIKKMGALYLDYKNDTIEAHSLLKKAAEMGDTESMFYLGSLYTVDPKLMDEKQAFKWIQMAVDKGWVPAIRQLGVLYRSGFGVKKDLSKAVSLLESASQKGDVSAYEVLADIYRSGEIDGKKDYQKSREYLMKAALKGSQKALLITAEFYLYGEGVEKDITKAIELLKQASENGLVEADLQLGDIYTLGKDVEPNFKEAYVYYKRAAEAGNKYGMFKLALAYLSGKGCEKDGSAAVNWLKKSAKLGYTPAIKALKDTGF